MSGKSPRRKKAPPPPGTWVLHDAKAKLSEVVRLAGTQGPQKLTVHGREAAVIVSPDEYRRLTGQAAEGAKPEGDGKFERQSVVSAD